MASSRTSPSGASGGLGSGAASLAPGDRLDRYQLLGILAQGGMGTIWLARLSGKLGFERLVALKTIRPSFSDDRQFSDMFVDEATVASRIDHENVARILDIGEDLGVLYYAMELIDGESLRKLHRDVTRAGEPFPLAVALRIAADACAGLHATHELVDAAGRPLGVVHRDVSPQNLLVTVRGTTKLIDFGVAKASSRRTEETATGMLKGKLEYMAPEQARGDVIDRRSDVYAVGAILYELLADRPMYRVDEGKQYAALHAVMTGEPPLPLPASIPRRVRTVVACATAPNKSERYRTAEAMRHDLEQAMFEIGQSATADDVAAVLAHYSRERMAARREMIEAALERAGELVGSGAHGAYAERAAYVAPSDVGAAIEPYTALMAPPPSAPSAPSMRSAPPPMLHGVAPVPMFTPSSPPIDAGARPIAPAAVVAGGVALALVACLGVIGVVVATRSSPPSSPATPFMQGPPVELPSARAVTSAPPVVLPAPVVSASAPTPAVIATATAATTTTTKPVTAAGRPTWHPPPGAKPSASSDAPKVPTKIGTDTYSSPDEGSLF